MTVSAQRLARTGEKKSRSTRFIWRTDDDVAETRARLAEGVINRIGSWIDGNEFQIATSSDPTSPVLVGTIRPLAEGSEVTAELTCRREVRDVLRLGRMMLLGLLAMLALALPLQVEGPDLGIALTGLALGSACAAAVASSFEANMVERARKHTNVGDLTRTLQQFLG